MSYSNLLSKLIRGNSEENNFEKIFLEMGWSALGLSSDFLILFETTIIGIISSLSILTKVFQLEVVIKYWYAVFQAPEKDSCLFKYHIYFKGDMKEWWNGIY